MTLLDDHYAKIMRPKKQPKPRLVPLPQTPPPAVRTRRKPMLKAQTLQALDGEEIRVQELESARMNQTDESPSSWNIMQDDTDEGALFLDQVPVELTKGPQVDLAKWSLLVDDKTCRRIAFANSMRKSIDQVNLNGAEALTDAGLASLANSLEKLQTLEIAHAKQVTDAGLRIVAEKCLDLQRLNLSNCHGVTGAGVGAISDYCHYISWLSLNNCTQLQDWVLLRVFHGFGHLKCLNLSNCQQLTDELVNTMAFRCQKLETLLLDNCYQVSDKGLVYISDHCPQLVEFHFSRRLRPENITDIGILTLSEKCRDLHTLDISGCTFVSDVGIRWLADGCGDLRSLTLNRCEKITDIGLRAISERCHGLQHLFMTGLRAVSDIGLRYLSSSCKRLETLELSLMYLVSDGSKRDFGLEGLQAIAMGCHKLQQLNLSFCFQIVERSLKTIAVNCPLLAELNLRGCKKVTEAAIIALAKGCRQVRVWNLSMVQGCNRKSIRAIAKHSTVLQDLNLSFCDNMSNKAVAALKPIADQLISLDLSGCKEVDNVGIDKFSEAFTNPRLEHLYLNGCVGVTQNSISKLSYRCSQLLTLSLKGCQIRRTALRRMAPSWKYTQVQTNDKQYGYYPRRRASDRKFIDQDGALWVAVIKIQSLYRGRQAKVAFQHKREVYLRHMVATRLQSMWRARQARRKAMVYRLLHADKERAATVIQRRFRSKRDNATAEQQIQAIYDSRLVDAAILVQHRWRKARSNKLSQAILRSKRIYQQRLEAAVLLVQRSWRGMTGRRQFSMAQAAKKAELEEAKIAADKLEELMKGREARQAAASERAELHRQEQRRNTAASKIQFCYRARLCRRRVEMRAFDKQEREKAAIKLQSIFRSRRERQKMSLTRLVMRQMQEEEAVVRIQRRWRYLKDRRGIDLFLQARYVLRQKKEEAAKCIQKFIRDMRRFNEGRSRLAELVRLKNAESDLLQWAATVVQAKWKQRNALRGFSKLQQAVQDVWKELIDHDDLYGMGPGAPYYFNQANGDVRWRPPSKVLEGQSWLSLCDQCGVAEGVSECIDCYEYFCQECCDIIHGGGKRAVHERRRIVDFYGKYIDYGDGTFPSIWPFEIYWDSIRGYDFVTQTPQDNYSELVERIQTEMEARKATAMAAAVAAQAPTVIVQVEEEEEEMENDAVDSESSKSSDDDFAEEEDDLVVLDTDSVLNDMVDDLTASSEELPKLASFILPKRDEKVDLSFDRAANIDSFGRTVSFRPVVIPDIDSRTTSPKNASRRTRPKRTKSSLFRK